MKTKNALLIICCLFFFSNIEAQGKKKPVAPKENTAYIISLLGKNLDDATLEINEKLTSIGVNFTKVTDDKDFVYDENQKSTEQIYSYFKYLNTDNGFTVNLTADENRKIIKTTLVFDADTDAIHQKIKLILGKPNTLMYENANKSVYRQKDAIYTETDTKIEAFTSVIPNFADIKVDSLQYGNSMEEMGSFINRNFSKSNIPILYAERKEVYNDHEYNFINYVQNVYYQNGCFNPFYRPKKICYSNC